MEQDDNYGASEVAGVIDSVEQVNRAVYNVLHAQNNQRMRSNEELLDDLMSCE